MKTQGEAVTWVLDAAEPCLIRNGSRLPLSPKDFALLHYLLLHRGRVIPHHELLRTIWQDTHVSPEVLKVRIGRLRRILGDAAKAPRFIKSVHGEGYRFIANATVHLPAGADRTAGLTGAGPQPLTEITPAAEQAPDVAVVGRDREIAAMYEALLVAAGGARCLITVSGEPGIGKTTLIDRFLECVSDGGAGISRVDAVIVGRGQCVEIYGRGEPYLPVNEALERLARSRIKDGFTTVLRRYAPTWLLHLPALLNAEERTALQRQASQPSRDRMLRELAEAIEVLTTTGGSSGPPLLILVLEDLQWADRSTIDLLSVLTRRREPARLLVIGSWRPLETSTTDHALLSLVRELRASDAIGEVVLAPLSERDVARYLDVRFPENAFPADLASHLCQRTEGNPLFFTSVIRDLLANGVISRGAEGWCFQGDVEAINRMTPPSIRQLVIRQCERLMPEQQRLLEAASLAGLEFTAGEVSAALAADPTDVEDHCLRLAERGQFIRPAGAEEWPDGTETTRFAFLHAVHREAWLERVGVQRRSGWHLRIADRKEAAYGARAPEIAAELAVHFDKGRDYNRAVAYYEHASWMAAQRVAHIEARAHLDQAFSLLQKIPETSERLRRELRLQIGRGALGSMTDGYAAAETAAAYRRARAICEEIGDMPDVFQSTYGLCRFFWVRGELDQARDLAGQLLRIAQQQADPVQMMAAHAAFCQVSVVRGDLDATQTHGEAGLRWYRSHWHSGLSPVYGHLGILCSGPLGSAAQLRGYSDRARPHVDAMIRFAETSSHPFAIGLAYWGAALFYHLRRDVAAVAHCVEEMTRIWSPEESVEFAPFADIFRGWALVMQGREEGVIHVTHGVDALRKIGADLFRPYALGVMAECHRVAKCGDQAVAAADQALAAADLQGQSWYDAELHRLRGELWLESAVGSPATDGRSDVENEAERSFEQAIAIARRQDAKWLELRATLSLGQLWRRQGADSRARPLVRDVYAWFTEGLNTPDLIAARAFLESGRYS